MSQRVSAPVWITVVFAAGLAAFIVVPNLLDGRRAPFGVPAALASLKHLVIAQEHFKEGDKDGDEVADYATSLAELAAPEHGELIDVDLASGTKQGFRFALSATTSTWSATAAPMDTELNGERSFYVDQTGVIRFAERRLAGPDDPPLGQ